MKKQYQNELLGQSKSELKKEWISLWEKILCLDPVKDYKEVEELNKRFDKCVEAYYAIDCGDYWEVNRASRMKGYTTYKVMKQDYDHSR